MSILYGEERGIDFAGANQVGPLGDPLQLADRFDAPAFIFGEVAEQRMVALLWEKLIHAFVFSMVHVMFVRRSSLVASRWNRWARSRRCSAEYNPRPSERRAGEGSVYPRWATRHSYSGGCMSNDPTPAATEGSAAIAVAEQSNEPII